MKYLLSLTIILIVQICFSQSLKIDPTFNPSDSSWMNGNGPDNIVYSSLIQPDGKIIIAGDFNSYNSNLANGIIRINQNGTIDDSFLFDHNYNTQFRSIVLLNNGKILVGGQFTNLHTSQSKSIIRLNADGGIDSTFNANINSYGIINSMSIQTDGKIIIGGVFNEIEGLLRNGIARLHADGSLDTSFSGLLNAPFQNEIRSLAIQQDGKIVFCGSFNYNSGPNPFYDLARLTTSGDIDPSFQTWNNTSGHPNTILIQPNGKILIGGEFSQGILRLNIDGSIDLNFNSNQGFNNDVHTLILEANGEIIVGGDFTHYNGTFSKGAARLSSTGSLLIFFNLEKYSPGIQTISAQSDGKIIFGGHLHNNLIRTLPNGAKDLTFNSTSSANGPILKSILQPDGKIIVFGSFDMYNHISTSNFIRLHVDGSLDSTFISSLGANASVKDIKIQTNGQILVCGTNSSYGFFKRFNIDGSLDSTFFANTTMGGGVGDLFNSISIQYDGKIIIGGVFDSMNGFNTKSIARLHTDGSTDTTFFSPPDNEYTSINCTAIQPNGQIIIGGSINSYQGVSVPNIIRVNSNGTLDTSYTFVYRAYILFPDKIFILPSNKILIAKYYTLNVDHNFTLLNSNGSLDTTFQIDWNNLLYLYDSQVDTNGKILAVGGFNINDNFLYKNIFRLNSNGSLDTTFIVGLGPDDDVHCINLQTDGKIIIGGKFRGFNGISRNKIARLEYCSPPARPLISYFAPNNLCEGDTTTLFSSSGNSYLWTTGQTIQSIFISDFGYFRVIVKDSLSCSSLPSEAVGFSGDHSSNTYLNFYSCDSLELNGQFYSTPGNYLQTFTGFNGCDSNIHLNLITLSNPTNSVTGVSISSDISNANYQWINCQNNEIIIGATSQTYTPSINGNYAVIVSINGCLDTSDCITINSVNLEEYSLNDDIIISPNPTTGLFKITCQSIIDKVTIYNYQGKIVLSNVNSTVFDISEKTQGVYLIEISTKRTTIFKRLILN